MLGGAIRNSLAISEILEKRTAQQKNEQTQIKLVLIVFVRLYLRA